MRSSLIDYRDLKKQFESEPDRCVALLLESFEKGHLDIDRDFSLKETFKALVPDGEEFLYASASGRKGGVPLLEATTVDSGAFNNITGQIIFSKIREGYTAVEFLYPDLSDEQQTPFPYGEKIPGVGGIGNKISGVGEGDDYPTSGLNEEWIDVPATTKKGLIVQVTREAIEFDRTGLVLKRANEQGYSYGVDVETRTMDVVVGNVNNYKRNGVATNSFLTSGAYINSIASSNALTDWTSVQALELLFDAILDPNTSLPINVGGNKTIIVPTALKATAFHTERATQVDRVDNTASPTTYRTHSMNPLRVFNGGSPYQVVSNQYVKRATGSISKWFLGNWKKAICRFYNWKEEITSAADNNQRKFAADIWAQFKISTRDVVVMMEPRVISSSNA